MTAFEKPTSVPGTCRDCARKLNVEDRWVTNQIDFCADCYVKAGGSGLPDIKRHKPKGAPK